MERTTSKKWEAWIKREAALERAKKIQSPLLRKLIISDINKGKIKS